MNDNEPIYSSLTTKNCPNTCSGGQIHAYQDPAGGLGSLNSCVEFGIGGGFGDPLSEEQAISTCCECGYF